MRRVHFSPHATCQFVCRVIGAEVSHEGIEKKVMAIREPGPGESLSSTAVRQALEVS